MKILFITNDLHDLVYSREPFAQFLNNQPKIECELLLVSNAKGTGTPTFSKTLVGLFKLFKFIRKHHFEVIIIRGVELSILAFPIIAFLPKLKKIIYITGLGRLWGNKSTIHTFWFRVVYRAYLKILRSLRCSFWLQNTDDIQDLNLMDSGHVVNGSGIYVRRELNSVKKFKQVVYAGRISYLKGLPKIIALAQILPDDWKLIVCGEMDESITNCDLDIFNGLVDKKKIIFKGFVSDMSQVFKKSSFAFYPSSYREGTPRFVLESMSYGLIPIIPNKPGFKKIMEQGKVLDIASCNWLNLMLEMDDLTYCKWAEVNYSVARNIYSREVVYKEKLSLICGC